MCGCFYRAAPAKNTPPKSTPSFFIFSSSVFSSPSLT